MSDIIIVGIDDSDCARRAALYAAALVKKTGATLKLVSVVEWSPFTIYTHEELEGRHRERDVEIDRAQNRILAPLATELESAGVGTETIVRHGHVSRVLVEVARECSAAHIVIGRRGRSKFAEVVFGSTASNLVQASPVPVTVVP